LYLAARQTYGGSNFPGGIFASFDGGVSWTRVLADEYADAVAIDPTDAGVVYAGLRDDPYHDDSRGGGLKLSTDGGGTWTAIDDTLPSQCIYNLTIDPSDRTRLYVGTQCNGVFRLDLSGLNLRGTIPRVNQGGIVIHASAAPVVSPGSLVDIYGTNLAAAAALASGVSRLPTTLGGVQVRANGTAAPLIYVGPTQIVFQMPYQTALGTASVVVVSNNIASSPATVTVQQAAPFVLTYGSNRAVAINEDGSLNDTNHPAGAGDYLTIYMVGAGPVDNPVADGAPASSSPLSRATLPSSATIEGAQAQISYLGLAPGFVGLVQANIQVPQVAPGDHPLVITVGGIPSNSALVTVK
jgi:uncharacterized protein (TIGR03437 family)